jgi:dihydroxy-acid dehydratase
MVAPRGVDRGPTSYGDPGFSGFLRRAFLASSGFDEHDLDRPIIGVGHTSSDYVTCHREMPQLVEAVRRGVFEAGGLPLVFPTMPLAEILLSPTAMLFRNLLAMEAEELLRGQPMDGAVLVGGCDKTVPAHTMAALSADVPAVQLVAGPMLTGSWRGQRLGACTDCRGVWARHRAGEVDTDELAEVRDELAPTGGTCMVMGTASTMACLVETLGLAPAGSATAPAPSGDRLRIGAATGRLAVAVADARRRPSEVVDRRSLRNAAVVLAALGGSTNAVVHLLAIARRAGADLTLDEIGRVAAEVPVLVDCKPVGVGYLEDLHRAGGVPALLYELEAWLDHSARVVEGGTLGDRLARAGRPGAWQSVVRGRDHPVSAAGGLAVVRGSLAPDGAVGKAAAASPHLLRHRGPAVVFESPEDVAARIDDPALGVTEQHVLVLRNAGPVGAGMPEAGSLPIPRSLAEGGVRDLVRVSDARMSGTAYGTVVLHVSPEAAVGGPLALVRDGDPISLDVERGVLDLEVASEELAVRRAAWTPPALPERGWARLYAEHVLPAHLGADLDLLGVRLQG